MHAMQAISVIDALNSRYQDNTDMAVMTTGTLAYLARQDESDRTYRTEEDTVEQSTQAQTDRAVALITVTRARYDRNHAIVNIWGPTVQMHRTARTGQTNPYLTK